MVLFHRVRLFLASVTSKASATAALATLSPPHVENNKSSYHAGGRQGGAMPLHFSEQQKQVRFQLKSHDQGLRQFFLTLSWDLCALYLCSFGCNAQGKLRALKGLRVSSKALKGSITETRQLLLGGTEEESACPTRGH